jgi:hypothetical protein
VGADKAYDGKDFVRTVRELNVTPHITKNEKNRSSNLDQRTTWQPGYAISLSRRWLIENGFGWLKQTGPLRQVKLRGLGKVDWLFVFSCAAHNLIRLLKLINQSPGMRREPTGTASPKPRNPMTTAEIHDSNRFQLGKTQTSIEFATAQRISTRSYNKSEHVLNPDK